eukprot:8715212-Pyramimonas_sp.AAC.1
MNGVSSALDLYDASNAFARVSHADLARVLACARIPRWKNVLMQRLSHAIMSLGCAGGVLVLKICSGTLPGDTIAGLWFLCVYHLSVDRFQRDTLDTRLCCRLPWMVDAISDSPKGQLEVRIAARTPIDISLTSCADDVGKRRIVTSHQQCLGRGAQSFASLQAAS